MKKTFFLLSLIFISKFLIAQTSIMWNTNINTHMMTGLTLETTIIEDLCIFTNYKVNVFSMGMYQFTSFGDILVHPYVDEWSEPEEIYSNRYTTYENEYGSYVSNYSSIDVSYGTDIIPRRLFNIGIGMPTPFKIGDITISMYLGIGICKETHRHIKKEMSYYSTTYNLNLVDYFYTESEIYTLYYLENQTQKIKTNKTCFFLMKNDHFLLGCGFDTRPMGYNMLIGFQI